MIEANRHSILTVTKVSEAAAAAFARVFRKDWTEPGYLILTLPANVDSKALRQFMVSLKNELSDKYAKDHGEGLGYLSLGRFDQQNTTKLHLDGAPEISFLMLGYEPTSVLSELQISDYTRCAADLKMTPSEFLEHHNPMFESGREKLINYTTHIRNWDEDRPRVVVINNSHVGPMSPHFTPGVLHGAHILKADFKASRIINSTMIAPASAAIEDTKAKEVEFLSTEVVSGVL